jgi:hypothetical protein
MLLFERHRVSMGCPRIALERNIYASVEPSWLSSDRKCFRWPHESSATCSRGFYHALRLSDIKLPERDPGHEFIRVEIASFEQVTAAAEGMDAIINWSVVRQGAQAAFDVNMIGCWNMMTSAVKHGIRRGINTGPHLAFTGPSYEDYDYTIPADVPPQSATNLYGLTKSVGQEVCRVFICHYDLDVLEYLVYNVRDPQEGTQTNFNWVWLLWNDGPGGV